jgi:hypothetical protein
VIGAVAADLFTGYPKWFVSIRAHSLENLDSNLTKDKPFAVQIVSCVTGAFPIAITYFLVNIYIKRMTLVCVSYKRLVCAKACFNNFSPSSCENSEESASTGQVI